MHSGAANVVMGKKKTHSIVTMTVAGMTFYDDKGIYSCRCYN